MHIYTPPRAYVHSGARAPGHRNARGIFCYNKGGRDCGHALLAVFRFYCFTNIAQKGASFFVQLIRNTGSGRFLDYFVYFIEY